MAILLGDSNVRFIEAAARNRTTEDAHIGLRCRSIPGGKLQHLKDHLPAAVKETRAKTVILHMGTNDIVSDGSTASDGKLSPSGSSRRHAEQEVWPGSL